MEKLKQGLPLHATIQKLKYMKNDLHKKLVILLMCCFKTWYTCDTFYIMQKLLHTNIQHQLNV